jgi:tetratricopeptide (TPR) repeat protein
VNIELGRIAAREGDVTEAVRYYHNAVEGSWRESPEANRRKARLELAEYLVRSGDFARAQAELIPLSADLPEDVGTMVAVGGLLLASGAAGRARDVFEAALASDRRSPAALSGAADAAFQLGEYASAVSYFRRATAAGADAASLEPEASLAAEVLRSDPFQRRLSARERASRASAAYERAVARAAECPAAASHATELEALRARATLRALQRDLDLVETVMELAYRTETSASRSCSATADAGDTALLLIGRQHFGT